MKLLTAKEILKLSPSELADYKAKLTAEMDSVDNAVKEARSAQLNEVGETIKTFPAQIAKILGRDVSLEEFASYVKGTVGGTLGRLAASTGTADGRGRRLTDEVKVGLRADMLKRGIALKGGQSAEQVTVIATRHGVTPQTCDAYKPTAEQLDAAIKGEVVPATAS